MEQRVVVRAARVNIDLVVPDLRSQTATIHAAYIFTGVGWEVLHIISNRLGATPVDMNEGNWKAFGDRLGISRHQLDNIHNYFQERNGPVWLVLATYAQLNDAMVEKVIFALQEIKRVDIINQLADKVPEFVRGVSDLRKRMGGDWVPIPPWVCQLLQPADQNRRLTHAIRMINVNARIAGPPVEGVHERINDDPVFVPVYVVMLTYANDGTDAAARITRILRSYRPRIGVLLFNEQMSYVFNSGFEFVEECFEQVDAIVPILTPGYYDAIRPCPLLDEPPLGKDQEFVRPIYQAIAEEYRVNNFCNRRVHCLVPNENKNVPQAKTYLRAYMAEAKIEELIENLLETKLGRKELAAARRREQE